jgi:hypothetical protein
MVIGEPPYVAVHPAGTVAVTAKLEAAQSTSSWFVTVTV